ncbi:hypothetical protein AAFC00_000960 [Neodothiora populina]|uniref:Vezatin n=1 Tax=Neodothiora populina TaxID=2781224 RepID=A0ABR3PMQ1_9PEZI
MESIVSEETPLAAFLEGEGTADDSFDYMTGHDRSPSTPSSSLSGPDSPSFAPRHVSEPRIRKFKRLRQSLQLRLPEQGTLSKAHAAWSKAVNSRIGRAENEQFLEHFRYTIVASQLLDEYPDLGSLLTTDFPPQQSNSIPLESDLNSLNLTGVLITIGAALAIVLLIKYTHSARANRTRILSTSACLCVAALVLYAYIRRQSLKSLRCQAVTSISDLTTNVRGLEMTSSAALSLIQEVELVSKGYRLSTPLPPISRFEDAKGDRKCARLRRCLANAYAAVLPAFRDAHTSLATLLNEEDLDRLLDVYDIPHHAIQEATNPELGDAQEVTDGESLKSLRIVGYQYTTLRRTVLCSLMSLGADGGKPDFARWWAAIDIMRSLATVSAKWAQKLNDLLRETEQFTMPATPKLSPRPTNDRLRAQVRNITNVSSGIRSLQAKMALLREESNKAIQGSEDLTDLGPNLMSQYESIGADLKMLMQAWETGKASLANNIDKQERRISLASGGLRSPASSLGGLTAVEEGGPEEALRALMGETKSNRSSLSASDEEVFEGISLPRQRPHSTLTREERISKMQEERLKQVEIRSKRDSSTNMIRELQSVMVLRNPKRNNAGRITSV